MSQKVKTPQNLALSKILHHAKTYVSMLLKYAIFSFNEKNILPK